MPECPHCQQADAAVHLRQHHADREQGLAADPAAPAGAGQGARHRAAGRAAFCRMRCSRSACRGRACPRRWAAGCSIPRAGPCSISARPRSRISRPTAISSPSTTRAEAEENQRGILKDIEGIVLLDGTWSQAKALWWRNAWMLKCQRVILGPAQPSRYGKLRKEPRGDGLSTIEAAAMLLCRPRKAARYRRDAARQFRADAGAIPGSAGHHAGDRAQAEKEGLSPAQAGLIEARSGEAARLEALGCLSRAGRI